MEGCGRRSFVEQDRLCALRNSVNARTILQEYKRGLVCSPSGYFLHGLLHAATEAMAHGLEPRIHHIPAGFKTLPVHRGTQSGRQQQMNT
jgi:hypothetical protein